MKPKKIQNVLLGAIEFEAVKQDFINNLPKQQIRLYSSRKLNLPNRTDLIVKGQGT